MKTETFIIFYMIPKFINSPDNYFIEFILNLEYRFVTKNHLHHGNFAKIQYFGQNSSTEF